jgi:hypothetical protein
MTDDEIRDAVEIIKQRALNVAARTMSADKHIGLIRLIYEVEGISRGFPPKRPREEILADIQRELERVRREKKKE